MMVPLGVWANLIEASLFKDFLKCHYYHYISCLKIVYMYYIAILIVKLSMLIIRL